ncbi:MAG: tetratricopeptide repeat protein, partial [Caulobacterales bacterium]
MSRVQRRQARKQHGSPSADTSAALRELFAQAVRHHAANRLAEAEVFYRRVLEQDPRHADSLHGLGVVAYQLGRNSTSRELIGQAIAIDRRVAAYHSNLGNALAAEGRLDDAVKAYELAITLSPRYAEAHNNLGGAFTD